MTTMESKSRATAESLLTREQVAEWLQVAPRQVPRLGVPAVTLGRKTVRYVRADVEAWLDKQRTF